MNFSFFGINDIDEIVGKSKYILNLRNIVSSLSKNFTTVLLSGEEGTGKKLIAETIYSLSKQNENESCFCYFKCNENKNYDFEKFCSIVQKYLSFVSDITFYFEDVDCLELSFQNNLYNYIKEAPANFRFIFSSKVNLEDLIDKKEFNPDLFFIISSVLINTTPVYENPEDVPELINYYFDKTNSKRKNPLEPVSEDIMNRLANKVWRGNIKEIKMSIEKAFLSSNGKNLTLNDFGFTEDNGTGINGFVRNEISGMDSIEPDKDYTLKTAVDNFKKNYVTKILEENDWNQTKTSKLLGIQRTYVIKLMNDLNIKKY